MLADLIVDLFGDAAAKRYRAIRWVFRITLLVVIGMIAYGLVT